MIPHLYLFVNYFYWTDALDNVLIDTGATTLCLPPQAIALRARYAIAQLGLDLLKEVDVITAAGLKKARIFQDAKISLLGREGTFECLELPGQGDALLGVIPLEAHGYATLRDRYRTRSTQPPTESPPHRIHSNLSYHSLT